jgi:hypothetical protein
VAKASDPRFLVLHALRLKGFADVDVIAAHTGLYPSEVRSFLDHLRVSEDVTHRDGRVSGWALTGSGRRRHGDLVTAELESAGLHEAIDLAYRKFLQVNKVLLAVCTDWQMREMEGRQVLNDHEDPAYDREVIERLRHVDDGIQPVCAELSELLLRFAPYGPRLRDAMKKVESGDFDWFTKPLIDSYHSVWFELHEDLLVTLGIERSREEG